MVHARFDVASLSITHFFAISFCPVFCLWTLFWRLQEPSSSSLWCLQLGGWGWSRGVCPCSLDLGFDCVTVTRACPGYWGVLPHGSVFPTVLSAVSPCSLVGGLESQICFLAVLLSAVWGWGGLVCPHWERSHWTLLLPECSLRGVLCVTFHAAASVCVILLLALLLPHLKHVSPCLFNSYAKYIMRHAGLDEAQAGIKTTGRNTNNLRYADDTTFKAECKKS